MVTVERELRDAAVAVIGAAGREVLAVYRGTDDDFAVTAKADSSPLTEADRRAHRVLLGVLQDTGVPVLSEEGRDIPYAERAGWPRFWLVDPLDGTKEFIKRNGEFTVNVALVEKSAPIFGLVLVPERAVLYAGMVGEGAWRCDSAAGEATDWGAVTARTRVAVGPAVAGERLRVVASRSHRTPETDTMISELAAGFGGVDVVTAGSALKLCLIADGSAHRYPRLGPTMEWDTAAGHAVVIAAGGSVLRIESDGRIGPPLTYNKRNLTNPYFLASAG